MNKLISYHNFFNGERDAISLSFEYLNDGYIKVSKTFFNNSEMAHLFESQEIVKNKINIRETHLIFKYDLLQLLLIQLYRETNLRNFINERYIFLNSDKQQNISNWVDSLNDYFIGIHYSTRNRAFEREDYFETINFLLEYDIKPYTESSYFDYRETTKPKLDDVIYDDKCLYEFRVYNVGQANCSALIRYTTSKKDDYKVVIVFDFGCDSKHSKNKSLLDMIKHIDKDTFILISHFHYDHYNNIAANLLLKTRKWIFPNCISKSTKANRLFHVLLKVASMKTSSGTIYYLPSSFKLSTNISFHQYTGAIVTTPIKNSLINNQSIVSIIEIGETKVLIPADATYEVYSPSITSNKYNYILIPHHGCYYPPASSLISAIADDNTKGIVQSGFNYYGHPDINHLNQYSNKPIYLHTTLTYNRKIAHHTEHHSKIDYYPIHF